MATAREASAIAKKQLALRDLHWPNMEVWLWDRKTQKGFTTIPKTMPLILKIMDEMTKGAPVSSTYLTLWCNTWDNNFVVLNKPGELAHASGFGGQRGEHTWSTRVKKLQELEFIDITPGRSSPLGHAIIWNPHLILRYHHHVKTPGLTQSNYTALIETALELGITDMTVPWNPFSPKTLPTPAPAAAPDLPAAPPPPPPAAKPEGDAEVQ
ncbi:hypothetical protein [Sphingomonas oryzagri]